MGQPIGAFQTDEFFKNKKSQRMPVLFVGHGSPMNIVAHNTYTQALADLSQNMPKPKSILVISAHWETEGTLVHASPKPQIIHDFFGFPPDLYKTGYESIGSPELAIEVEATSPKIKSTLNWGLDHGAWSVLYHMYPAGDIPVTQLSLNLNMNLRQHMDLAKELVKLRDQGVLIIGSGNLVHNLRAIQWKEDAVIADWAQDFDAKTAEAFTAHDFDAFLKPENFGGENLFRMAHPSLDHYLPVLYSLGASTKKDQAHFIFEGIQNASISMRSVLFSED